MLLAIYLRREWREKTVAKNMTAFLGPTCQTTPALEKVDSYLLGLIRGQSIRKMS